MTHEAIIRQAMAIARDPSDPDCVATVIARTNGPEVEINTLEVRALVREARPVAHACDIAELLIDQNADERLSNNGLIASYAIRTGVRVTAEVRAEALRLYDTWMGEQEHYNH